MPVTFRSTFSKYIYRDLKFENHLATTSDAALIALIRSDTSTYNIEIFEDPVLSDQERQSIEQVDAALTPPPPEDQPAGHRSDADSHEVGKTAQTSATDQAEKPASKPGRTNKK